MRAFFTDFPVITNPVPNTNYTVHEGNNITIECQATGDPSPQITWYQDGNMLTEGELNGSVISFGNLQESVEENSGVVLQSVSRNLTLSLATNNVSGLYSCQAENAAGNVTVEFQLTVLGKL